MSKPLKILFIISEVDGFVKTGGLADVGRALPLALQQLGHQVICVLPFYRSILERLSSEPCIPSLGVPMGDREIWCAVRETRMETLPMYLIEHQMYFFRDRLYDDGFQEFADNAQRFGFFSKAVLQLCKVLQYSPDIIHCNDWQTALVPFYLKAHEWNHPLFQKTKSLITIHNSAFQGKFAGHTTSFLGIPPWHWTAERFEDFGMVNFLKGGLAFADKITAVSPGYAEELLTPVGSHGLHEAFLRRQADFTGILNGCDDRIWNPAKDSLISHKFDRKKLKGKTLCKQALQKQCELPVKPEIPVLSVVSRLTEQKGLNYLIPGLYEMLQWEIQVVLLGSGEPEIETGLLQLAHQFPHKMKCVIGYNEPLAHQTIAGSDLFLMPSLFEPCGMTQMYSLRYGTLPIVRAVGGLRDTVQNYNESDGSGTGFVFNDLNALSLTNCVGWAVSTYHDRPNHFQQLIQQAMAIRFDWKTSAMNYEQEYYKALGYADLVQ